VLVEEYLARHPPLADDPEALLDLVYAEFVLREERGEAPTEEEYLRRFPRHAEQLRKQIGLHRALGTGSARTPACDTPSTLTPGASADPAATRDPGAPAPGAAPGSRAPAGSRFRVLRPHARGGLGEVSVARDDELNREVALKEIQPRFADDAASRARFLQEAEVTGRLEHPGVVPVYGLGAYPDGRPFYAMRLIKGQSLQDAIDRLHRPPAGGRTPGYRDLEFRQLLARFLAVCNTIAYAHSRGVLHRDLKPANVMLGPYGETLVVDWGLAKVIGRPEEAPAMEETLRPSATEPAPTRMGSAIGTPPYMSPEQADGRLDELGPATDVYGLGATLYTLLTGKAPVEGKFLGEVLDRVRRGDFPPPRRLRPDVPRPLEAVCRKAMAREPGSRYASALGLAADVEHWLGDEPVSAYPEPLPRRLARLARRHRTLVASGVVTLLLVLAGAGAALVLWGAAEQRRLRQAHEYLFNLRTSAEADEALALAELHAGRFDSAEQIVRKAAGRLGGEPSLAPLHARLGLTRERVQRLVDFYWLADEAERREAEQSTLNPYAPSGEGNPCEDGLRRLGVFDHPQWWTALPDDDLLPAQKDRLRNDAYHQLLLLTLVRAKMAVLNFGKPAGAPAFRAALESVKLANGFRPDSYSGSRMEYFLHTALGQPARRKPLTVLEPGTASDYYFAGIAHLAATMVAPDPASQFLFRWVTSDLHADTLTPLHTAERYLRLAGQLDPQHYWSFCWLGLTLRQAKKGEAAELAYAACIGLRPNYVLGHIGRCQAIRERWLRSQDPKLDRELCDRALACADRAVELAGDDPRSYLTRATARLMREEPDLAIEDCGRALRAGTAGRGLHLAQVYGTRAEAYLKRGEAEGAIADLDRAIGLEPFVASYREGRARAYMSKRQWGKAVRDLDEAIRLDPGDADTHARRGVCYLATGEPDRSRRDFEAATRLRPGAALHHLQLGWARALCGRRDDAAAALAKSLQLKPAGQDALGLLANLFAALGASQQNEADYRRAIEVFGRLAKSHADAPGPRVLLAAAYQGLGRAYQGAGSRADAGSAYGEALAVLDKLAAAPAQGTDYAGEQASCLALRGGLYAAAGEWERAAADFTRATTIMPAAAPLWHYRAVAHLGAGDPQRHRADCAEMLRRFGGTEDPVVAGHVLRACLVTRDCAAEASRLVRLAGVANHVNPTNLRLVAAAPDGLVRMDGVTDNGGAGDLRLLAAALYRADRPRDAMACFDESVKQAPPGAWEWLFLALAHQKAGEDEVARQYLMRAEAWLAPTAGHDGARGQPATRRWHEKVEAEVLHAEAASACQRPRVVP
jgi:tetratricopeptide (TPR) repeat protein/tRNA A-37 threonylcarbamoyl transferase component Bud32